jgi:hypothetical protein
MARRRTAAEQIGVPELDEQEEQQRQAQEEAREQEAEEQRLAAEAERQAQEPSVPDWVPEKFRDDPSKFAKSYRDLEEELRRRGVKDRETEERMAELEAQVQQRGQTDPQDFWDQMAVAYEDNPLQTVYYLTQQAASAAVQQAFGERSKGEDEDEYVQHQLYAKAVDDGMATVFDDWNDSAPGEEDGLKRQVAERISQDPSLFPDRPVSLEQAMGRLSMIYKDIKYDQVISEQQQLRERGLEQKDVDRARKQQAQTLSGASGRAPEPTEAETELAEMRSALASSSYGLHRAQEKPG